MSSLPECVKCGRYVHSGPVLCDVCRSAVGVDYPATMTLLREAYRVLLSVPRLAQGPSRELWDGIMSDVLDAKRRVGDAIDALKKPPAPERTYSAEEVRAAFVEGTRIRTKDGYPLTSDEAEDAAEHCWPTRDGEARK